MADAELEPVPAPARSAGTAYFSMEIALVADIPTYSGGLGVLAGDVLRAAADDGIAMVGVSLVHRKGYFRQRLDAAGRQSEEPQEWRPEEHLHALDPRASLVLDGRVVRLCAWRFDVRGVDGHVVPVYLLDTALEENDAVDRSLTDHLYGGDESYRLSQEALLGLGGIAMLRALGYGDFDRYHMNEGHSSLLALALLEEHAARDGLEPTSTATIGAVRRRCVFTTHTPVPAGHDQFPMSLARKVLGSRMADLVGTVGCCIGSTLNMTYVGLFFSGYINGVSMRHETVSRGMFPAYPVNAVTNGVHAATWTAPAFCDLYDTHFPQWRRDNRYLRYAVGLSPEEIWEAHRRAKHALLDEVRARTGIVLDANVMLLGFARRATAYKRADLLVSDQERLRRIAREAGPLQILYAGKAHPRDEGGKALIRRIHEAAAELSPEGVRIVYLEDYDMGLAALLCAGVDLWLNTPQKPLEASGTSGMKAALNGVPSLSVLDGWWVEGHVEGVTGWAVGSASDEEADLRPEAQSLYAKLEYVIVPMFYARPADYARVMQSAIALNGSFFNAQRMVSQYVENAYNSRPAG